MQTKLNWHKGFFSTTYQFYDANGMIGKLSDKTFSKTSSAEISGSRYSFETKGFLHQHTIIYDELNRQIGDITYGNWMTKATLNINGKSYNWKYDNVLNTRWTMTGKEEGISMTGTGSFTKGQIIANMENPLLGLCGLYITNYFSQISIAIMVAVFVPIWASIIH